MLGPSGSGKTTLLTALAGRLTGKLSGAVTYNNHPFSSSMRRNIGFVSQEDVLYPHLTVIETLTYAAMLKLPRSLTREEKMEQAEMIIGELGLSRCRNNLVGGGAAVFRGISGGERKRVNIGQEMLVNPSLLLLDEPTSGLDSTTAQRIVAMLHSLALSGRTVVTTIHQPSSRLFWMFDKVVLLSDGYPIFTGQAGRAMDYFESVGFVPTLNFINPADFLLDLANGKWFYPIFKCVKCLMLIKWWQGRKFRILFCACSFLNGIIDPLLYERYSHESSLHLIVISHGSFSKWRWYVDTF